MLVGKKDYFYLRLESLVKKRGLSERVVFFGQVTDRQLANLYTNALSLVFPSLMEGFGLPLVEALYFGSPVICADIPVFHEILGDLPLYFNPLAQSSLLDRMQEIFLHRNSMPQNIASNFNKRYSWQSLTNETLRLYKSAITK